MKPETVHKIGATARKVPGMPRVLDARARWRLERYDTNADRRTLQEAGSHGGLRVNVGAGDSPIPGWVNVDLAPQEGGLVMDATKPWPLPDGSVSAINSEHFLEHIEAEAAPFYFSEGFRVLEPGGRIRTSTPDLRGLAEAYLTADPALLEAHRRHGYTACNHADMLNNYVYSWGHEHIYDYETIALLLEEAGFERIERALFGQSSHDDLRGVDTHDVDELHETVVVVDAVKPA